MRINSLRCCDSYCERLVYYEDSVKSNPGLHVNHSNIDHVVLAVMIKRKKQFSPCDFENTLAIRLLVPHHIVPEDLVFGVFSVLLPKVENMPSN